MKANANLPATRSSIPSVPINEISRETRIRRLSESIGEKVGQAVTDLIDGILVETLIRGSMETMSSSASSPAVGLLTPEEVAKLLCVSKSKVYGMMRRGYLPTVRIEKTVRVRRSDLDDFIQQHIIQP